MDPPFCDAGVYVFKANVWDSETDYGTFKATLTILPKDIVINVDDILEGDDYSSELTYTIDGLIGDDELEEYVGFNSDDKLVCEWENKNYNVTLTGGRYKKEGTILDSYSRQYAPSISYIPNSLTPVAFKNSTLFAGKSISSISFILYSKNVNFNEKSEFTIYIVSTDYNTKLEDCTVENGRKIVIDITDKIRGASNGDLITLNNLDIEVGLNETLAFGDPTMNYCIGYYRNNSTNLLVSNIFNDFRNSVHTLPLVVKGYYYK